MRSFNLLRKNSITALALGLFSLAAGTAARADVVLDNLTVSGQSSATLGTTIGSAFNIGSTPLALSDVIFPQLRGDGVTDLYDPNETVSVSVRNADGTVGTTLFTNFTISHDTSGTGQTEADANVPFLLLPNQSYYFSVNATTTTAWGFTMLNGYNMADGVTVPTGTQDASYKVANGSTSYFTMAQGPQLIYIDAVPVTGAIPEPSTVSMLALAVAGTLLMVGRSRGAKNA